MRHFKIVSRLAGCFVAFALAVVCLVGVAGAQVFQQPVVVPTPQWPYSATEPVWATNFVVGDIDGDGRVDISYVFTGTGVYNGYLLQTPLFGKGTGSFTPPQSDTGAEYVQGSSVVQAITTMIAGGRPYLVSVQGVLFSGNISLVPYTTSQTVDLSHDFYSSFYPAVSNAPVFSALSVVDVNGDGVKDILVEDSANNLLYVLLNNGAGAFTVKSQISVTTAGMGIIVTGDFNHDGKTDILVLNTSTRAITPYFGNGDGTFSAGASLALSGGIYSMVVGDVNGDGVPDVVVEGAGGALSYFPGVTAGTTNFVQAPTALLGAQNGLTGEGGHLIAVESAGTVPGTSYPRIITSTPAGISVLVAEAPVTVGVPYNYTFNLLGIYNAGPGHTTYGIADFNGDGIPDLAVDSPEGVAILLGNSDGSFQTSRAYAAGQPAYSVATGVFTGSGNVDAVVAVGEACNQVLNGDGAGNFAAVNPPTNSCTAGTNGFRSDWSSTVVGDFDGDGKLDLANTVNSGLPVITSSGVYISFGNGDGTFYGSFLEGVAAGSNHVGVSVVGDFNGDGISDLVNRDVDTTSVYFGNATTRSYVMPLDAVLAQYATAVPYGNVASGFLNAGRSNMQDVVVQSGGSFLVEKNNGNGTFTAATSITPPVAIVSPNASTGAFPDSGYYPSTVLLEDVDGDGYGDLVILYHNLASNPAAPSSATSNLLYVYWGQGNGNFYSTPTDITLSRNYYQATVAKIAGSVAPYLVLSDGYLLDIFALNAAATVNEQHYLAGQGINLVVAADTRHRGVNDLIVANGGAVLTAGVVNNGVLASNAEVNTGGVTVLLNSPATILANVTGTLVASPEPSLYGANFTLTATLTQPSGSPAPTGTVTFSIAGTAVGTGTVTNGVATYTASAPSYTIGTYALSAAYSGDANYNGATLTGSHTVSGLQSAMSLTVTTPTIFYGQIADATAQVSAVQTATGATLNGGTITFYIDGVNICVLKVMSGNQNCPANAGAGEPAGTHSIYAVYSGNQYYLGSTSVTGTFQVLPDATAANIATSGTPSNFGQTVTFTSQVTALYATPTGAVNFYDGSTLLGSAPLNAAGVVAFAISTLAVGTHTITAQYPAPSTGDFQASSSVTLTQMVVAVVSPSVTLLSSSVNPSVVGQSVTFTASVSGSFAVVSPAPTGAVTFYDGTTSLGTFMLNAGGTATVSTSTLTQGTHSITATYGGSGGFQASTSAILSQVVNALPGSGFTLTVTPGSFSVGVGSSVNLSVAVTESGSFSEPVQLSCANVPSETTCLFAAMVIPAGGGTTALIVSPSAPHDCGASAPYFVAGIPGGKLPWLAGGMLCLLMARRRRLRWLAVVAGVCLLPLLGGCGSGNCTDFGVKPGTYSFVVTGTAAGTPETVQSQTVQMSVHI